MNVLEIERPVGEGCYRIRGMKTKQLTLGKEREEDRGNTEKENRTSL